MSSRNPDAPPTTATALIPAQPPKALWHTPGGVALLAGVGFLAVGGLAWALTRNSGTASCGGPWAPQDLTALAHPGHYRIDVGVPIALVQEAGSYPTTEADWENSLQKMASQLPQGITVEGIWLPAITITGSVRGPYSYPPNTPMPSDWPMPNDGLAHARLQILWPYSSDIASALLSSYSATKLQQDGITMQVLSCPTGPVPSAIPLPVMWTQVAPDASGNVTFQASGVWLISGSPPQAPSIGNISLMKDRLTKLGFTVIAAWDTNAIPNDWPSGDSGARWRFIVANDTQNDIQLDASHGEKVYAINTTF